VPASANNIPETRPGLSVTVPVSTFPANTPFHFDEGFATAPPFAPPDTNLGMGLDAGTHFDLSLDGVAQRSQVDIEHVGGASGWFKGNLTNYPVGLPAGSHTFVGVFVFDGAVVATYTATILFT
jgi:hypothetical protein